MRRRNCGYCAPGGRHGNSALRTLGTVLLVVGILLLIVCLPIQFWGVLLGLILAGIGFVLIRWS